MLTYLFLTLLISKTNPQYTQNNLPSSVITEENLDDSITQIFNRCKCVIFYLCDEQNFIIPSEEVSTTKVLLTNNLKNIRRIRCSNNFYYCCRNRTAVSTYATSTSSPSKPQCGKSLSFSTTPSEFPWVVAVLQESNNHRECVYKCGAALIHPKVVLTAQHCVRAATPSSLKIITNTDRVDSTSFRSTIFRKVVKVRKIILHKDYYSGALHNDIALLIIETPIETVTPICLPKPNQNFNNKRCMVAGWGSNRTLRKVDLPIIGTHKCENLLQKTRLGVNFKVHASFLCAGGEEGKDTCQGDGGSPLMCLENNRYIHVGILSWGVECGYKDVPSLYSNVPKFINWIQSELGKENLGL